MKYVMYAVVDHTGALRNSYRGPAALYRTLGMAKRCATQEGDSVLVVDIDLDREPVFIRSKVVR